MEYKYCERGDEYYSNYNMTLKFPFLMSIR